MASAIREPVLPTASRADADSHKRIEIHATHLDVLDTALAQVLSHGSGASRAAGSVATLSTYPVPPSTSSVPIVSSIGRSSRSSALIRDKKTTAV